MNSKNTRELILKGLEKFNGILRLKPSWVARDFLPSGENLGFDELIITHDKDVQPIKIQNTGNKDLIIFKFFGLDLNQKVPMLDLYRIN